MKVMHIDEVPGVEIWVDLLETGRCTCYRLVQPHFCQTIDIAHLVLSAGARTRRFSHDTDWAVQVTGGRGTIATDEMQVELTDGVMAFVPAGETRWVGAAEDSTLSFMSTHRPKPVTSFPDRGDRGGV